MSFMLRLARFRHRWFDRQRRLCRIRMQFFPGGGLCGPPNPTTSAAVAEAAGVVSRPSWRNWQTRMVQVHVPARVWGFESLRWHQDLFWSEVLLKAVAMHAKSLSPPEKLAKLGMSPIGLRSQSPNCTMPSADAFAGTPL